MTKPMTFEQWCGLNGRRWMGAASYEEFKKNTDDYYTYLSTTKEGKK